MSGKEMLENKLESDNVKKSTKMDGGCESKDAVRKKQIRSAINQESSGNYHEHLIIIPLDWEHNRVEKAVRLLEEELSIDMGFSFEERTEKKETKAIYSFKNGKETFSYPSVGMGRSDILFHILPRVLSLFGFEAYWDEGESRARYDPNKGHVLCIAILKWRSWKELEAEYGRSKVRKRFRELPDNVKEMDRIINNPLGIAWTNEKQIQDAVFIDEKSVLEKADAYLYGKMFAAGGLTYYLEGNCTYEGLIHAINRWLPKNRRLSMFWRAKKHSDMRYYSLTRQDDADVSVVWEQLVTMGGLESEIRWNVIPMLLSQADSLMGADYEIRRFMGERPFRYRWPKQEYMPSEDKDAEDETVIYPENKCEYFTERTHRSKRYEKLVVFTREALDILEEKYGKEKVDGLFQRVSEWK